MKTSHDIAPIIKAAKERCVIGLSGIHGVAHWQRVRENGVRLAKETGANRIVVELFAFVHDCCREDDFTDPEHGPRAAEFLLTLRKDIDYLDDGDFDRLHEAIRDHTFGQRHFDVTIGTCWDSDRLDIGRVGPRPHPRFMSTASAKDPRIIDWAFKRSRRPSRR